MYRSASLILVSLLLVGCSGKPGEREIARLMNEQIKAEVGEGTARIENLTKTNGFEKSENTYIADIEFDLVFERSLAEISQQQSEQAPDGPLGKLGAGISTLALSMAFGSFEAGDSHHLERKITLINTEKGWRLDTKSP